METRHIENNITQAVGEILIITVLAIVCMLLLTSSLVFADEGYESDNSDDHNNIPELIVQLNREK